MNDASPQNPGWKLGNTLTLVLLLLNILSVAIWLIIFHDRYETISKVIGGLWAAITVFLGYIKIKRRESTLADFMDQPPVKIFVVIYTILNIAASVLFILWHGHFHTIIISTTVNDKKFSGATVYWNEIERGKTNADGVLKFSGVKGGNHLLHVKLPDGTARTMGNLFVWLSLTKTININFEQGELQKGYLKIETIPSQVQVKIENLGNIPIYDEPVTTPYVIALPEGEYRILFSKQNFESKWVSIQIFSADTISIEEQLKCARGSIRITSEIQGADIYLNGHKQSPVTPHQFDNLCVGKYSIKLIKKSAEFENYRVVAMKSITVTQGTVQTVHFSENDFTTEETQ